MLSADPNININLQFCMYSKGNMGRPTQILSRIGVGYGKVGVRSTKAVILVPYLK